MKNGIKEKDSPQKKSSKIQPIISIKSTPTSPVITSRIIPKPIIKVSDINDLKKLSIPKSPTKIGNKLNTDLKKPVISLQPLSPLICCSPKIPNLNKKQSKYITKLVYNGIKKEESVNAESDLFQKHKMTEHDLKKDNFRLNQVEADNILDVQTYDNIINVQNYDNIINMMSNDNNMINMNSDDKFFRLQTDDISNVSRSKKEPDFDERSKYYLQSICEEDIVVHDVVSPIKVVTKEEIADGEDYNPLRFEVI
jgi:hypothetical protein